MILPNNTSGLDQDGRLRIAERRYNSFEHFAQLPPSDFVFLIHGQPIDITGQVGSRLERLSPQLVEISVVFVNNCDKLYSELLKFRGSSALRVDKPGIEKYRDSVKNTFSSFTEIAGFWRHCDGQRILDFDRKSSNDE